MIRPEIINYFKEESEKGINSVDITAALLSAGWQKSDIDDSLGQVVSSKTTPNVFPTSNLSAQTITEKNYPVQSIWVLKSAARFLLVILFFIPYLFSPQDMVRGYIYIIIYGLFMVIYIIIFALRRINFHYVLDLKFLTLRQGVLNKQQRNIPYGVIQNVYVRRDLFDRVFGLASLSIENAAGGGSNIANKQAKFFGRSINMRRNQPLEEVGFQGNKVNIPGLTVPDAETLKNLVLQKMKENPIEDSQSGL